MPFVGAEADGAAGDDTAARGVVGARYVLPLLIEATLRADTAGGVRVAFEKELPLLPRLDVHGEASYDTHEGWDGKAELLYAVGRRLSLVFGWDAGFGWGAGFHARY